MANGTSYIEASEALCGYLPSCRRPAVGVVRDRAGAVFGVCAAHRRVAEDDGLAVYRIERHPMADAFSPVDLAAIAADDEFLDSPTGAGELVELLTAWRTEIRTTPIEPHPDVDTALAVINAARP